MSKGDSPKSGFNKTVFCLYQSTSDELMIWCWFNVLILSMNYGLSMTQISLTFSVSFWIALAMKAPGNFLAKKLRAGRCVLLASFLYLSAACFLTFGRTLAVAIVGQSLCLIAESFQEMSTVIVKNAAERDPEHVDYMSIMSMTGVIHSVISLFAAIFMSRLYKINENLPMYICVGFCLNSCILAYLVSRYDGGSAAEDRESRREALPGMKIHSFDKTTISCLFLSILFMVIFTVSGDNLKIMIENDLSALTDKNRTVFLFSMVLLASRLVKGIGGFLLYASQKFKLSKEKVFSVIVCGIVLISVFGYLSKWAIGFYAIILAVVAFLIRVMIFDPFRFSINDFMLKRLKEEKMINVLFVQATGSDVFTALFSTLSTILLNLYGMQSVMLMLLIISILFAAVYSVLCRNLKRINGNRNFIRWSQTETESTDSLLVATAVLLMHYDLEKDPSYQPIDLADRLTSVEDIHTVNGNIEFDGFYDYGEETLKEKFYSGHPCAIRTVIKEGEPDCWLPVMYLDNDGGVIWNPYSKERFLAELYQIREICCFTIR